MFSRTHHYSTLLRIGLEFSGGNRHNIGAVMRVMQAGMPVMMIKGRRNSKDTKMQHGMNLKTGRTIVTLILV